MCGAALTVFTIFGIIVHIERITGRSRAASLLCYAALMYIMEDYQFSVDLGGMISILSEHLYSSPDVFLRELIQNGADAITMRSESDPSFRSGNLSISVVSGKSISFTDNGSGLTEEEIHKFVSVIGQSSKRGLQETCIGRFGIGLLSCFIVTDEIILRSRSVKTPSRASEWHGFTDGRYSVKPADADIPIGTEITFSCKAGYEKYFSVPFLIERARYYALPLPYPICVGEAGGSMVQANILPGVKGGGRGKKLVLETGKAIFGTDEYFIDYIPLESPTGLFSGAAYILPYTVSAVGGEKRHRIYLKNMLLTENGSSLLPEWAFFLRCFLNTSKLRPTASREDFCRDDTLAAAKEEISQCIADYLEDLSVSDRATLSKIGDLHGTALKSVACENERLFDIFMPYFKFETSLGTLSGSTVTELGRTVFYTTDIDIFRQMRPIFAEQDILLVNAGYVHVKDLLLFAAKRGIADIQPLRENIIDETLGECTRENEYRKLIRIFSDTLSEYDCRIVMKSFAEQLACLYSSNADDQLKHDIERSIQNGDALFADILSVFGEELSEDPSAVLYLNCSNDLINRLNDLEDTEKLTAFAKILYVQSLIAGGYPVYSREMNIMNDNLIKLIEWGI